MITWENYEEYMMMHADGELLPAEEQELLDFINEHPQLKKEMEAYQLTRSMPDTAQTFGDKAPLLKPAPKKHAVTFPVWAKYSIAAGVALLVFISLLKYQLKETEDITSQSTANVIPAPGTIDSTQVAAKNPVQEQQPADNKAASPGTIAAVPNAAPLATNVVSVAKTSTEPVVSSKPALRKDTDNVAQTRATAINELPIAGTNTMPYSSNVSTLHDVKDIPAVTSSNDAPKETFWDKLPIEDTKKAQLKNIASTVANVYKDVNATKEDISEKNITIKIEKRRLIISF